MNSSMNINLHFGDCISGMAERLAPESIDLTVTSIPFGALFMYSGKNEDIGNNADGTDMRAGHFGLHMRFFIEQLFRVQRPGTNVCIHIQQLLRYKNQHGYMGRRDFRGAVVDLFEAGGFEWTGEVVIPKNPQIIAKRLNLHCLMFETGKTNARKLAPAVNDYVMIFQKPGESVPVPAIYDPQKNPAGWLSTEEWIRDAHGVWKGLYESPEDLQLEGYQEAMRWWIQHVDLETGIWDDIRETDVLDNWQSARSSTEEKHVCPLQLEVIRRCVRLYTNPGETVLDPFMGIGSTAVVALEQQRNAVGFELKESYHALSQKNLRKFQQKLAAESITLFDSERIDSERISEAA